ncbi:MAG: hypothetical protein LJE95_11195 [Acidobacteria bacterium]|nr:hypothetical protein [Acidobacteriota bacterium]
MHPSSARRRALLVIIGLGALQLVGLASLWPGFWSPNEYSRVFAARAFVARGSFEINDELTRFGCIDDVARVGSSYYSNKPPGLIWACVPVVAAVHLVHPQASPAVDLYCCRVALVSFSSLGAAWLLALWVKRRRETLLSPAEAAFLLLFATPFGVYSGLLFAHSWTGFLVLATAFLLLGEGCETGSWRSAVLAGLCAGLALGSEYPAAVVIGPIILAGAWRCWRRWLAIAVGAILPLIALGLYNSACFGSPLTVSYRFEAVPRYHRLSQQMLFGFGTPSLTGLAGLLVSPLAGLLFFAPVLLPAMGVPVVLWRRGEKRLAAGVAGAVWLLPLIMSGYAEWSGGATFGPRYLVLGIPLWILALACLRPNRSIDLWVLAALAPSAVVALLGRITPPFAIDDVATASTLRGWSLPTLVHGLWNTPLGVTDRTLAAWCLAAVACAWVAAGVVAFGSRWKRSPVRVRLLVVALAAVLLSVQLGIGTVTPRQQKWLRWVAPSFMNLK